MGDYLVPQEDRPKFDLRRAMYYLYDELVNLQNQTYERPQRPRQELCHRVADIKHDLQIVLDELYSLQTEEEEES